MARYQADIRVFYDANSQSDAANRIRSFWRSAQNLAGDGMADHDLTLVSAPKATPPPLPPRKK
jgi:hypothetical protein